MKINVINTSKGDISYCRLPAEGIIETASDFLDLLGNCRTQTVAIDKESLSLRFFELRSGLAGEFLQKISNYRRKLIIIGDFAEIESDSLRSFIYESNKGGDVLFVSDIEAGVELLR